MRQRTCHRCAGSGWMSIRHGPTIHTRVRCPHCRGTGLTDTFWRDMTLLGLAVLLALGLAEALRYWIR